MFRHLFFVILLVAGSISSSGYANANGMVNSVESDSMYIISMSDMQNMVDCNQMGFSSDCMKGTATCADISYLLYQLELRSSDILLHQTLKEDHDTLLGIINPIFHPPILAS